ncbi:hypothetical protein GF327_07455 [Candidatus Woesearchaeota archaeon]|nr:hypothetical protein [Candidatus Woesearchaeota archaeon]
MVDKNKKYPEGHFLGVGMMIGIVIFSGVGVTMSISTDNPGLIGIGPSIGVAIGLAIGKSMEEKYRKQGLIRPLTSEEKKERNKAKTIGIIVCLIGLIIFISIFFLGLK